MAPAKWTAARRSRFLAELRRTANISAAARVAGINRKTAYRHRMQSASFREDWDHALEEALDDLEAELRRRAISGVEKPVYYGGKPCGSVTSYSDALGMFLLRHRRSQVFSGTDSDSGEVDSDLAGAKERLARLLGEGSPTAGIGPDIGDGDDEERA